MTRPLDVARWHPWLRDRSASVSPATEPISVTFPTTRLVTRVQIALGADLSADPLTWPWADITPWVRYDMGISLNVGRRDEASTVQTGTGTMKLDNRDGRFTRRNPNSPYYGLLSKNTPIWATVDAGSGEKTRMEMYVNEWPKTWADKSATDSTVTIQVAGILRRLAQGRVLKSPLRRAILAAQPIAYWALEDGTDATEGISAVGGLPMVATGTLPFGSFEGAAGSGEEAPDFTIDTPVVPASMPLLTGHVPPSTSTSWTVEFACRNDEQAYYRLPLTALTPGGTHISYSLYTQIGPVVGLFNGDLTPFPSWTGVSLALPHVTDYVGEWVHYRFVVKQSGANIVRQAWVNGSPTSIGSAAGTLAPITSIELNTQQTSLCIITGSVSHVAVYDYEMTADHSEAVQAHAGEMAHERILRLCAEEGINYQSVADQSPTMGPQGTGTVLELIREAEAVGGGVLYERNWGLSYQSLRERYNATVGMALDFTQGHVAEVPQPADDDQRTRNRFTASRALGSDFTAEETAGPMGTGAQGPGVYDDGATLNVETDAQLAAQAGWRVHLGTIDEDRWPNLALNFTRRPTLIDAWTALSYGSRITVANPVSPMPPEDLDQIIEGYSERWDPRLWTASMNCSPGSAYRVHVVASTNGNLGRVDAANSTLAADATSSATTLSVASPIALWRTGTVNFDIDVGGEQMTVTNITGGSSPQTFTVTRSVNGIAKAQPAMVGPFPTKVSLWKVGVYAL